jgi:hypothetical protein
LQRPQRLTEEEAMTKNERIMIIELTQAVAQLGLVVSDIPELLPKEENKKAAREKLELVQGHLREVIKKMGEEWS